MTGGDPAAAPRPRFALAAAGALLLVLAAYANHFGGGFHFDDSHVIEQNLYLRSLANLPRFFTDANTFSSLPANLTAAAWRAALRCPMLRSPQLTPFFTKLRLSTAARSIKGNVSRKRRSAAPLS